MPYPAQQSRFVPPRGVVVLLLIVGAVVAGAFWIGPFRPIPAELRLVAAGVGAGAVVGNAGAPGEPRFPLVLALENRGGRVAQPVSVSLSLPAAFRVRSSGTALERESVAGNPLVRYELPVPERRVAPGAPAQLLVPGDTLWLEPRLSDWYCTTQSDSIPEFVPAPAVSAAQLADVQLFYSLGEASYRGRAAGLLRLRLDPAALANRPAPQPPNYPMQLREPELPRPELGLLRAAGTRSAECGDPQQPLELYTVTWETAVGGRFIVVYLNGAPRKQLFDLNRDSIIELEMWDPDADGRFEARRAASYAIPSFLLPERSAAAVPADSVALGPAWEALFADTARGPFRFTPDSLLPPGLKPVRIVVDSAWLRRFNQVEAGPFRFVPDSLLPPKLGPRPLLVDSAWLGKFNDVSAGPYRFSENPPPRLVQPKPTSRPQGGPVPLGTPLPDYPRPPRR
jgi:hypothetical protein